jgi:hypothetical protein
MAALTCEFNGSLVKLDLVTRTVLGYLRLSKGRMPQDIVSGDRGVSFSGERPMGYKVGRRNQGHPLRRSPQLRPTTRQGTLSIPSRLRYV